MNWCATLGQAGEQAVGLKLDGMVVMVLSIAIVTGLTIFCIARIFRESSPGEHHHAPLDIDTHDRDR